jgi:RHS repeat-associated protein
VAVCFCTIYKKRFEQVERIRVYADYSNNWGCAYFDNIQIIRKSLAYDVAENMLPVQNQNTEEAFGYKTEPRFTEAKDGFGNVVTETAFMDGEMGTLYRAFGFSPDGNNLVYEIDNRGGKTEYTVDVITSRKTEVVDRCGNKTSYEYDATGKPTKVTNATPCLSNDDASLIEENSGVVYNETSSVSYSYDVNENVTEIIRGDGLRYVLNYDMLNRLKSIGVAGKDNKLVEFGYNRDSDIITQVTYANGYSVRVTHNSNGQVTEEKWYEDEALVAHYCYAYDGYGNLIRSVDFANKTEYNYYYEEGRVVRATEKNLFVNTEGVIDARTLVNTILYLYNAEGNVYRKRIISPAGEVQDIWYQNTDDGNTVVKFQVPDPTEKDPNRQRTITAHSKADSFGRKLFDEVQLATGAVARKFHYHDGEVTQEHKDNIKVKSKATTQLVSKIEFFDGRTLSYEYDAEERITKVNDSVDGTVEYTYDAQGQLLTETVNGTVVNSIAYDNYGNITSKNGVVYTYGDDAWKDLLTKVGEQTIIYDAQGNPTSYLGHTLTWEKGRQLKSFDGITYAYNANDIRTSKTVDGVRHDFVLDGTKILRETWGENVLIPLYDNEDSVCGICYNGEYFYFLKNLQGDIISVTDKDANEVAKYTYDAWGVCAIVSDTSACNIAALNPYRYRSYYYDNEIRMYYLKSRFYDPMTGRFLNHDVLFTPAYGEENLFAYCGNDPVRFSDPSGKTRIAVDPGHGGSDNGAIGVTYHIVMGWISTFSSYWMIHYEKNFNLNVAKILYKLLTQAGFIVYMTRHKDVAVEHQERCDIANDYNVDIFVSIHHNSSNPFKSGYLTLYAGEHDAEKSKLLATSISSAFGLYTGLKKAADPAKNTSLHVLNATKMPAVLVECGHMGGDVYYCRDNAKCIANAIYQGILSEIDSFKPDEDCICRWL